MPPLDQKKPSFAPAYVVGIYPQLASVAMACGYALALHGSLQRDLDLVAIPWTEEALPVSALLTSILEVFDLEPSNLLPEEKPHGRLSWSIPLWWGAYLDLSVVSPVLRKGE